MKILVACPVSNREWILKEYLQHVLNLDYDKKLIDLYWIVNNSKDRSYDLLHAFKREHKDAYNSITIEVLNNPTIPTDARSKLVRRQYTYHWLALLRNKMLAKCCDLGCDFLLSSDCDILMRSDTIKRLAAHNLPAVSALVYNGYLHIPKHAPTDYNPIENAYRYTNVLRYNPFSMLYEHFVNARMKDPENCPVGKLVSCDATGACILIRKDICTKPRYAYYRTGEDIAFSISVKKDGHPLYCDVSVFQKHIMSTELYTLYLQGGL